LETGRIQSTVHNEQLLPFTESEGSLLCLQEPTTGPILSHLNPVKIFTPNLSKALFQITLTKILYAFFISSM
jgi:hypothetical protein